MEAAGHRDRLAVIAGARAHHTATAFFVAHLRNEVQAAANLE
jgi:hypothetical protein